MTEEAFGHTPALEEGVGPPIPYRRNAIRVVAYLWGTQFSFLSPALALLLVSLFAASNAQVALVLAIYNGACLVTAWLVPRWADRHGEYVRPMFAGGVFTIALSGVFLATSSLPVAVIGLVLLGAPAAVGVPLLFGFIRHSGAGRGDVVRTRAVFSMAWVVGPPLAAGIISLGGGRALVAAIGLVGVLVLVAVALIRPRREAQPGEAGPVPPAGASAERAGARHRLVPTVVLVALVAAFAALQATNSTAVAMTTLFATHTLHLSPLWGGVALGVAAGLEVPALFLLGRESRRMSDVSLLGTACVVGAAYYLLVGLAPSGYVLVALQVLNAASYAVVAGVGLTLFQAIIAGPGAAAGLLSNAQRVGALLSAPLIALGSFLPGGIRAVFVACAGVALLALVLVRLAAWRMPRAVPRA